MSSIKMGPYRITPETVKIDLREVNVTEGANML